MLVDSVPDLHDDLKQVSSSSNGVLIRYQEKLADKFLSLVSDFRENVRNESEKCIKQITEKMNDFFDFENKSVSKRNSIIDNLGSTATTFESLKENLEDIGVSVLESSKALRGDVIELYDRSFHVLRPVADRAYKNCSSYITQVPLQYADRLDREINTLNRNYLKNKQDLLTTLYNIELKVIKTNKEFCTRFDQKSDEWRDNKFSSLVDDSKNQLGSFEKVDFGSYFEDFYKEQGKFTLCFKKSLQNVTLISPPNNFSTDELNKWWSEVEEILELHSEFIKVYYTKISELVNEKNRVNSELLAKLETDLVDLKGETESSNALAELTPLFKQSQKYNSQMLEKINKYWEYKKDVLRKSFEAVKKFLEDVVINYNECITKTKGVKEGKDNQIKDLTDVSNEKVKNLENELDDKIGEIKLLVDQSKINACVNDCNNILEKIEKEYRDNYANVIKVIDGQSPEMVELYELYEAKILDILKLKKIAPEQELDSASIATSDSARKGAKAGAGRASKKASKNKIDEKKSEDVPALFALEDGSKLEQIGTIEIIPEFGELPDDSDQLVNVKGKGAKPPQGKQKKTQAAKKKPGGKAKDADDDIEVPDFSITETLQKIDGNVSIHIYVPVSSDLFDWIDVLRKQVVSEIYRWHVSEVQGINSQEEKKVLADELNEKMRVHAPRAKSIELNVAQARTLQVESRKTQLERHIRQTVSQFNNRVSGIDGTIEKRKDILNAQIVNLRNFIVELGQQKSTSNFSQLSQSLHIADKQFTNTFENIKSDLIKEIESFATLTNASNERFVNTIQAFDSSCTEEEREMCNKYFSKMSAQVDTVVEQLKEKTINLLNEINQERTSIVEEYDILLPVHKADVGFIEKLNYQFSDAKSKSDTLLFRNRQREEDVNIKLADVEKVQHEKTDNQTLLIHQLEELDSLRILLIKRAEYLSLIKSDLGTEQLSFTIDLSQEEVVTPDVVEPLDDKKKSRPKPKRFEARDKGKKDDRTKSGAKNSLDSEERQGINAPFQAQLDQIRDDLISNITKTATEYYSSLKGRKVGITRPGIIVPTQQELIESIQEKWGKRMAECSTVIERSCLNFRSQVLKASTTARIGIKIIYDSLGTYFTGIVNQSTSALQTSFNSDMQNLTDERNANKAALNPRITDRNNESFFVALVDRETDRSRREVALIQNFYNDILEVEKKASKLFVQKIGVVTSATLGLFDQFLLIDDLKPGRIEGVKRATMKELLKLKMRKEAGGPVNPDRQVVSRQWPALPAQLGPLQAYSPSQTNKDDTSMVSSRSDSKKDKDKNKKKKVEKGDPQQDNDIIRGPTSLDTPLHQGTIVERNRCYDEYEIALKKRLDDLNKFIKSLVDETSAFTAHWNKCIRSLRPDFQVFETEKEK